MLFGRRIETTPITWEKGKVSKDLCLKYVLFQTTICPNSNIILILRPFCREYTQTHKLNISKIYVLFFLAGNYEIVFDDGCNWTCNTSRLHKLRSKQGSGTPSTSLSYGPGPSNANIQTAFHTHLFDPTRDYLGSKSERREMKRKLNIKEIFNIGQKKSRKQKGPDEKPHKTVERKPRILKKRRERPVKLKLESEIKTEPITEVPG